MNFLQFQTAFAKAKPSRIYLFLGPETYHHHQGQNMILDRYLPQEARGFCFSKFEDTLEEIREGLSLATTLPFGADFRVIVFRGSEVSGPAGTDLLETYLKQASPRSILIIEMEQAQKGSRIENLTSEYGFLIECPLLNPAERKKWIQDFARQKGYSFDYSAVSAAVDRAGENLWQITSQMDKIFDWMDKPGPVSAQTVERLLPANDDLPSYKLLDALSQGKTCTALQMNETLLNQGIAPLYLLTMITNQLHNWCVAKEMIQNNNSRDEIGQTLKLKPFLIPSVLDLSAILPAKQLQALYVVATQTDRQMKSSRMPPKILLESLIVKVASLVHSTAGNKRPALNSFRRF